MQAIPFFIMMFIIIVQHFSDCDGSAIFRISSNKVAVWNNSYQNPMQLDRFQTSSKFWLTWVGVHVLRVLSNITQKCCLINCINSSSTSTTSSTSISSTSTTSTFSTTSTNSTIGTNTILIVLLVLLEVLLEVEPVVLVVLLLVIVLLVVLLAPMTLAESAPAAHAASHWGWRNPTSCLRWRVVCSRRLFPSLPPPHLCVC
jgi:hypothetical protein